MKNMSCMFRDAAAFYQDFYPAAEMNTSRSSGKPATPANSTSTSSNRRTPSSSGKPAARKRLVVVLNVVEEIRLTLKNFVLETKALFKRGSKWYSGRVSSKNRNGTYDVDYDDGDIEKKLPPHDVRSIGQGSYNNSPYTWHLRMCILHM